MKIGISENIHQAFTDIVLLMAAEPVYASMPISRLKELLAVIKRGHYRVAVEDNILKGVLMYQCVSNRLVPALMQEGRMPRPGEVDARGRAKAVVALFGRDPEALNILSREFAQEQKGNYVFFERHYGNKRSVRRFGWVDPDGKIGYPTRHKPQPELAA